MSPTAARPAEAGVHAADLDLPVRLEEALAALPGPAPRGRRGHRPRVRRRRR